MRKCFIAPLILGLLSISATAETKLPVPEIETLPNGLTLVWFLNDKLPVIDIALMLKAGSRDDPPGKSGTAELVAATLDRGAGGMTAQQLAHAAEMLGASRSIAAGDDTFSLGMHGLAPDAAALLETMAKITLQPEFSETEFKREKLRLLDRWSHIDDYGEALVSLAYSRVLASGTSYGRGSLLSAAELEKVSRQDVVQFHHRYFTPKNSLLMVVGKASKDEFRKKILELFGSWSGEAPQRSFRNYADGRLPGIGKRAKKILIVHRAGLTQAQVRMGFPAPSFKSPDHYALVVANALLGEYFNSRLNSLIRDKLGLTYSISSTFQYSRDLATFTIASATKNESLGKLVEKTREVLKALKSGPIPESEVTEAKEYLIGGFPLGTSTLSAVASRWLSGYVYDLGPEYLNEFVPRISKVTAEDVSRAIRNHFNLEQLVVVVAGDAGEIEKGLKGSKAGPVTRIKASALR